MNSIRNIDKAITYILIIGTLISICLVMSGGIIYLFQHGSETLQSSLAKSSNYHITVSVIWLNIKSLSYSGLIELGLATLVFTQILRIAALCVYYMLTKDYWFIGFSMFILLVLINSSCWHHSL